MIAKRSVIVEAQQRYLDLKEAAAAYIGARLLTTSIRIWRNAGGGGALRSNNLLEQYCVQRITDAEKYLTYVTVLSFFLLSSISSSTTP